MPELTRPSYDRYAGIHGYHSGRRAIDPSSADHPFRIGLEIEKVDYDCRYELSQTSVHRLPAGWKAENDSSLGDEGYELVSRAYNLFFLDDLKSDVLSARAYIDAGYDTNCGGHIHISDSRFGPREFSDRLRPLFPLLMILYPKRLQNTYVRCNKYDYMQQGTGNKYQPFFIKYNDTGSTIELRIFGAVKNATQLLWRVRLLEYFMKASYSAPLTFGWIKKEFDDETSGLHSLLSEVYNTEQLKAKKLVYWSAAAFFFTDRPVHNVLQPIMRNARMN